MTLMKPYGVNIVWKTDLLVDKWVRQLVAETPEVLHVILGRDALSWQTHEPQEWQGLSPTKP